MACTERCDTRLSRTPYHRSRRLSLIHLRHRLIRNRERRPIDIPSTPLDHIQFPVRPADPALAQRVARHAFDRHAFEDVVVDFLVVRLHGDLARGFRIPD